jgi:hypothetical protein
MPSLILLVLNVVETFVVSWAMRENKLLVLHTVTNYFGTNLIFYDINDLILDTCTNLQTLII